MPPGAALILASHCIAGQLLNLTLKMAVDSDPSESIKKQTLFPVSCLGPGILLQQK